MSSPSLLVTIRTVDRTPKRNYLGATVRAFVAAGYPATELHVFPGHPNLAWLDAELGTLPVVIHAPAARLSPNENGWRQVSALNTCLGARWVGLFEDDLELCADAVGSMERWLADHDRPGVSIYRFFALPGTPVLTRERGATRCPLREMRGSQAVAMRPLDALAFAKWAREHPLDWRPPGAPFQDRPERGFDKLLGYWGLLYQTHNWGLVSAPMFVRHVGHQSALYSRGVANDQAWAGPGWSYPAGGVR